MMWLYVGILVSLIGVSIPFPAQPEELLEEIASEDIGADEVEAFEDGTDLGLYNPDNHPDVIEGDILRSSPILSKNAVNGREYLWPNAAVIYKVEDNVGCPYSQQCKILMSSMKHYEQQTCIRFKEWTGESNYISVFFNPDSGSCWSAVGMIGGEQKVSLGQRCWYKGIVIHELGHAVGFWHEMNRPDRDDWIYIFWENILPSLRPAFNKHDLTQSNLLGESFDYKSIMMYDEYAFSKDGVSPTLQAKTNEEIGPIWRKGRLSDVDIRRTHKLYTCNGVNQKVDFPLDTFCSFEDHTCGFKDMDKNHYWTWKKTNQGGFIHTDFSKVRYEVAQLQSINFHGLSSLDTSRGPLGCISFSYLILTDGKAYLRLSQAYLNSPQQIFFSPDTAFDLMLEDKPTQQWSRIAIPFYVTKPFKLVFESKFEAGTTSGTIGLDNIDVSFSACPNGNSYAPSPTNSTTTTAVAEPSTESTTETSNPETTTVANGAE